MKRGKEIYFENFSDEELRVEIRSRIAADVPIPVSRAKLLEVLGSILEEQPH